VVVLESLEAVAEVWVDSAVFASLKARAEPVVVRAVAEFAITARSADWATPTFTATATGKER
jgi:hypothetical protein